jgi:histidinol-phosphate aminotransferase
MNKLRTPFNVTSVGQAAALAALDDSEHVTRSVNSNRAERKHLFDELRKLGLSPVPSETNFLFIPVGPNAKSLCDELLHDGVIVRPMGWMGFPEAIRISVGNPAENAKLLAALSHTLAPAKNS